MWIDAHCHLTDKRLEAALNESLNLSKSLGVSAWVQGGISPDDWQKQEELKTRYPGQILTAFGMHPWWVCESSLETLDKAYEKLKAKLPNAGALGELGLDRGKRCPSSTWEKQETYFVKQLLLAKETKKPLVLHIVDAHAQAIEILKKHSFSGGIVHSFSGSIQEAKSYMDFGLTLSISGVITRDGYKKLKEALKTLPKDKIVIETDCPDQKLKGEGGELNLPQNLILVAEAVAQIRNESKEEVLRYSAENARKVFGI